MVKRWVILEYQRVEVILFTLISRQKGGNRYPSYFTTIRPLLSRPFVKIYSDSLKSFLDRTVTGLTTYTRVGITGNYYMYYCQT